MRANRVRTAVAALPFVAVLLGRLAFPRAALYRDVLSDYALRAMVSAIEVATLSAGALFAARAARRFGPGNPVRVPWLLFAGWLSSFLVAQGILSYRQILLRAPTPPPTLADAAFLVGYVCMLSGVLMFLRVYRQSGLAVGSISRGFVGTLVAGCVAIEIIFIRPIVVAPEPLMARVVNVAYPTVDLAALVAVVLLIRVLLPLRGGRVWAVWGPMLAALVLACTADILFAYFYFNGWGEWESLINLLFMASYAAGALAAWTQDRALAANQGAASGAI